MSTRKRSERAGSSLLEVNGLEVRFTRGERKICAVNGLHFAIRQGEATAIVGESGSGKTVSTRAMLGLLPERTVIGGTIRYQGRDLLALRERDWRRIRGREIGLIPQNALAALNPMFSVGWQIAELFRVHERASRREARRRAIGVLERVGIPAATRQYDNYPHEFSGGMRQRAMIAMAVALRPRLVVADEPTTALDVTIEAEVMELLGELRRDVGMAVIHITHDLGLAARHAERILVMYAGRIVEEGAVAQIYNRPAHPYTRALLDARPILGHDVQELLPSIPGAPPNLSAIPNGCPFHPRCRYTRDTCRSELPQPRSVDERSVACHYAEDVLDANGDWLMERLPEGAR